MSNEEPISITLKEKQIITSLLEKLKNQFDSLNSKEPPTLSVVQHRFNEITTQYYNKYPNTLPLIQFVSSTGSGMIGISFQDRTLNINLYYFIDIVPKMDLQIQHVQIKNIEWLKLEKNLNYELLHYKHINNDPQKLLNPPSKIQKI